MYNQKRRLHFTRDENIHWVKASFTRTLTKKEGRKGRGSKQALGTEGPTNSDPT